MKRVLSKYYINRYKGIIQVFIIYVHRYIINNYNIGTDLPVFFFFKVTLIFEYLL